MQRSAAVFLHCFNKTILLSDITRQYFLIACIFFISCRKPYIGKNMTQTDSWTLRSLFTIFKITRKTSNLWWRALTGSMQVRKRVPCKFKVSVSLHMSLCSFHFSLCVICSSQNNVQLVFYVLCLKGRVDPKELMQSLWELGVHISPQHAEKALQR